jgi:hypothetical protein
MISASSSDQLIATQLICVRVGLHLLMGRRVRGGEQGAEYRCVDLELGRCTTYGTNGIVGWGEQTAQTCANA